MDRSKKTFKSSINLKIQAMHHLKKITYIILWAVLFLPIYLIAQDRVIPHSEIPSAIQSYIDSHFPDQAVVKAEIDMEGIKKEYEIKLADRTELEFNSKHQIKKIDGKNALPASVIPEKIRDYVHTNYPNNVIIGWEHEWKHQEVKLDNGIELEFTMAGKFIRVDY